MPQRQESQGMLQGLWGGDRAGWEGPQPRGGDPSLPIMGPANPEALLGKHQLRPWHSPHPETQFPHMHNWGTSRNDKEARRLC